MSAKRQCGDCTLCCRLVPVAEISKADGVRCRHQGFRGCSIYATRPLSCRAYACAWLEDPTAADLRRPDHAGYVVDMMPDFIRVQNNDTGVIERKIPVVQIWLDPKRPEHWGHGWNRPGHLRRYLEQRGEEGFAAIMRLSAMVAFVLFPPAITGRGWEKSGQPQMAEQQHNMAEVVDVLKRSGAAVVANGSPVNEAWAQAMLAKL